MPYAVNSKRYARKERPVSEKTKKKIKNRFSHSRARYRTHGKSSHSPVDEHSAGRFAAVVQVFAVVVVRREQQRRPISGHAARRPHGRSAFPVTVVAFVLRSSYGVPVSVRRTVIALFWLSSSSSLINGIVGPRFAVFFDHRHDIYPIITYNRIRGRGGEGQVYLPGFCGKRVPVPKTEIII